MTSDASLADRIATAVLEGAEPSESVDHLALVARAAQAEDETRRILTQAVAAARAQGQSWAAIGQVLGMSRQAAQQRFGAVTEAVTDADSAEEGGLRRRLGPVTAVDELDELRLAGRQGWRTVGAGMLHHVVERTDTQWETRRVIWTRPAGTYVHDGWQVAVRAFPWLYLVRDLGLPAERT